MVGAALVLDAGIKWIYQLMNEGSIFAVGNVGQIIFVFVVTLMLFIRWIKYVCAFVIYLCSKMKVIHPDLLAMCVLSYFVFEKQFYFFICLSRKLSNLMVNMVNT